MDRPAPGHLNRLADRIRRHRCSLLFGESTGFIDLCDVAHLGLMLARRRITMRVNSSPGGDTRVGATIVHKSQPGRRSLSFCYGLILFVITPLAATAFAQPKFSPAEQYPGPWLEVTQEVRDVLILHKISACNEAVERQSSRNSGEYLLYCTQDENHWTRWHVQPATHKVRGPSKLFEVIPVPDSY